jgi:hypothetical protein
MKAPMFGITMFDKKVPNLWTCTRIDVRDAGASVTVAMLSSLAPAGAGRDGGAGSRAPPGRGA